MLCSWCSYNINLVYNDFAGYVIFDEYGYINNTDRFCSINCGVASINTDHTQSMQIIDKKIDYLYKYYNLTGFVREAPSISKLKDFGGTMSYKEYRDEFRCPDPSKFKRNDFSVYETYDSYDDSCPPYDYYDTFEPYEYQEEENDKEKESESSNSENEESDI